MNLIHGRGRVVVGLGLAAFVAFSIGCMNLTFGGRHEIASPKEAEVAAEGLQRGKSYAPYAQEVTVYYPVPYASPPNLEFEDDAKRQFIVMEQRPDCFKIKNTQVGAEFTWKARGSLTASAKTPNTSGAIQATLAPAQEP